jgi:hypothetical protein
LPSPDGVASALASTVTVPPAPPVAVPPVPPVVAPPVRTPPAPPTIAPSVRLPPVPWSTGRFVSPENGTSIPPSPDEAPSATAPASSATFPAAPSVAVPPTPPVVDSPSIPPVAAPSGAALPPEPPIAASGPAAPPLPPVATSADAGPSLAPASLCPCKGEVRSTQAANRRVAASACGTGAKGRDNFVYDYSRNATRREPSMCSFYEFFGYADALGR